LHLVPTADWDDRAVRRFLGFGYAMGVDSTTIVAIGPGGRWSKTPMTADELAYKLCKKAFRRITWREGTGKKLTSRSALRRVRLANEDGIPVEAHEPLWQLMVRDAGARELRRGPVAVRPEQRPGHGGLRRRSRRRRRSSRP
jgi:hypothetical protein